ncbi:helix-turn-helix domain-containing protein [Leifsonia xyli]|uniref:helix-turn-helix domain-containing protein n=1 Tax=Leifsonia xyli TaxID=1575 RepID=UPI003D6756A1
MTNRSGHDLDEDARLAVTLFGAEIRCRIVALVRTDAAASKAHIAEQLGVQGQAIRYHLDTLEAAGVLYATEPTPRQGRASITPSPWSASRRCMPRWAARFWAERD